jgi:F-type H+-transporting ATPase subunit delta
LKDTDVAIRYARALFQAADPKKETGPMRSALATVSRWFKAQPELSRLFLNPALPYAIKEKGLQKILPPQSPAALESFLKLLIRNKRLYLLHLILARFEHLADAAEGLVRADIRTPQDLPESRRQSVVKALEAALDRRVVGEFNKDESLLGGFVVQFGDKVMDLSILGQLSRLKETLIKAS